MIFFSLFFPLDVHSSNHSAFTSDVVLDVSNAVDLKFACIKSSSLNVSTAVAHRSALTSAKKQNARSVEEAIFVATTNRKITARIAKEAKYAIT